MNEIYLTVKEAKFGDFKLPDCSNVRLRVLENTRYHEHIYGWRAPICIFFWAFQPDLNGIKDKKEILKIVTKDKKKMEVRCQCVWLNPRETRFYFLEEAKLS